jgi:uncharacterized membrane protein
MKQFFSYLFALCAIACLAFSVYKAIPIFPYIKDAEVLLSFAAFLLFYYAAYRTSSGRKQDKELA